MFRVLKQRIADMRTISFLCRTAERYANADGQKEAGAEHIMLAALDLPDGTARKAFVRAGADPDQFRTAIAQQYGDALASVGIDAAALGKLHGAVAPEPGLYQAKPSVGKLMQQLAARTKTSAAEPLLGAHVVAAGASAQQGVAMRALRRMGLDAQALVAAAQAETASYQGSATPA